MFYKCLLLLPIQCTMQVIIVANRFFFVFQVRPHMSDGSCAALIVLRRPNRQYATQPVPEECKAKPRSKSHKVFWGTVGATVLTGAAVVYAK